MRRPSPATVIASIALFVSLSGVSYGVATGFIDSREIKNNTIRTKDLRNNDVRGRDIRNSTVRGPDIGANQVRGADVLESSLGLVPKANLANSATTAGALSSQRKISYTAATSTGGQTIYDSGKLKLTATCGAAAITVTAATSVSNATLSSHGGGTPDTNDSGFDTGETPTLSADTEQRTVVYSEPGGQIVVVQYGAFESATGCVVKGVGQTL